MGWIEDTPLADDSLFDGGVPWSHLAVTDTGVYVNGTRVADADGRPTGSAKLEAAARAALDLIDRPVFATTYIERLRVKNALSAALRGPSAP